MREQEYENERRAHISEIIDIAAGIIMYSKNPDTSLMELQSMLETLRCAHLHYYKTGEYVSPED